jgi:hypothetical protein
MRRQIVWFPDGSPVAAVTASLPREFEPHPLSEVGTLRRRSDDPEVLVVDLERDAPTAADAVRARAQLVPVVGHRRGPPGLAATWYAYLPKPVTPFILPALGHAFEHVRLLADAERTRMELGELNAIGVRLSAERDPVALLGLILTKAREITHSDAGSIYLVEEPDEGQPRLRFKLTQNDFCLGAVHRVHHAHQRRERGRARYQERRDPAPRGRSTRRRGALQDQPRLRPAGGLPHQVDAVVPMRTPAGETIGVLQLINCKRVAARRFPSVDAIERETIPYPERFVGFAASLASQAAVALQNSRLLENIQALFEGFVRASVTAIESRDPTTSGHSFRVADLTVGLAEAAD